ncbi:MAG: hypothetical protein PHE51_01455 [Eubacteriales bacterium]|nr:hypothetical protein [Eubacteriales bacterium]
MEISIPALKQIVKESEFHRNNMEKMKEDFEFFEKNPIPVITYKQFRRFFDDGNRIIYEREYYFARRERLVKCALLYMVYDDQKYLDMLEDVIWTICDEYTWCLPAHLWGKDFENVAGYRYIIDLFAAETGFTLSEILYLLGDKFSDMVKKRIDHEVKERIIDAFLNRKEGFHFEQNTNNWSAVCGGSVGITFMYRATKEQFEKAYPRIEAAMKCFLSGYGDDGCCLEGLGYWEYGFGFYTYFGEMLRRYTDGKIDYFADAKIEKIATYQQMAMLRDNKTISFSDGFETGMFHTGLANFLAKQYPSVHVPQAQYAKAPDNDHNYRWGPLLRNFVWAHGAQYATENQTGYTFKEDAQWYINTRERYAFAAKGGHNDEPHNHNDVGNFLFIVEDETDFADLGCGEYTRGYFGADRYNIVNNASFGHSIPEINGIGQKAGREYFGEVICENETTFELQLKNAYDVEGLESYVRRFDLNENGFTITDTFEGKIETVKERFVTKIQPVFSGNEVKVGKSTLILESEPAISSLNFSNHNAAQDTVYFIDAKVTGNAFKCEIII